jgi:putative endonuclease
MWTAAMRRSADESGVPLQPTWWQRRRAASLGGLAESVAARLLRRAGYRVIGRNLAVPGGELDMVVQRRDVIAVVEVRSRTAGDGFSPEASVDAGKRRRVIAAGRRWLAAHPGLVRRAAIRFDVVAVEFARPAPGADPLRTARIVRLTHHPDAFRAPRD